MRRLSSATRTMKNSSRFELKMARNFTRSSSGTRRVLRLLEHAAVELEPGQLAIDEASAFIASALRAEGLATAGAVADAALADGERRR